MHEREEREQSAAAQESAAHEAEGGEQKFSPLQQAAMRRRVLQRKAARAATAKEERAAGDAPSGGGSALPQPVQQKMERSFGSDFSDVRVHQDGAAASVGAQAFARGSDLHFAPGRYDPASRDGQSLIGHELTHVVQQRAGRVATQGRGGHINGDPALEREADDCGARAARGEAVRVSGATAGAQRKADGDAIQLKVDTQWGEFQDATVPIVEAGKSAEKPWKRLGVEMTLNFKPNEQVNATKIGFLQTVKTTKGGAVNHRGKESRAVPGGEHRDYRIDTNAEYNPIYGAREDEHHARTKDWENDPDKRTPEDANAIKAETESTKVQRGPEQVNKCDFGKHLPSEAGTDAVMRDAPTQTDVPHKSQSMQELETSAIALAGEDQGKYYGTVRWGWSLDEGADTLQVTPLGKTSDGMGAVTKAAAAQWNQDQRKGGGFDANGDTAVTKGANVEEPGGRLKEAVPRVPIKIPG